MLRIQQKTLIFTLFRLESLRVWQIRDSDPRFRNVWVCGYELQRVVSFCYFTIIILQDVYENGFKDSLTCSSKLCTKLQRKGDKCLSQFCHWFWMSESWRCFCLRFDIILGRHDFTHFAKIFQKIQLT